MEVWLWKLQGLMVIVALGKVERRASQPEGFPCSESFQVCL